MNSSHTVSIVIPCYNEVHTLEGLIDAVRAAPVEKKQIIVVNDASTDGTAELIRDKLTTKIDITIHHAHNQGKGAALRILDKAICSVALSWLLRIISLRSNFPLALRISQINVDNIYTGRPQALL